MKILIVLTSHDALGNTGKKTGFWLEEFAAPYYVFKDAGAQLTLVSPAGGQPPLDPKSDEPDAQTAATERFRQTEAADSTPIWSALFSAFLYEKISALSWFNPPVSASTCIISVKGN